MSHFWGTGPKISDGRKIRSSLVSISAAFPLKRRWRDFDLHHIPRLAANFEVVFAGSWSGGIRTASGVNQPDPVFYNGPIAALIIGQAFAVIVLRYRRAYNSRWRWCAKYVFNQDVHLSITLRDRKRARGCLCLGCWVRLWTEYAEYRVIQNYVFLLRRWQSQACTSQGQYQEYPPHRGPGNL